MDYRISERSGVTFSVAPNERFTVTTPEGRQVADLVAFSESNPSERFSQSYTRDLNGKLRITTGDELTTALVKIRVNVHGMMSQHTEKGSHNHFEPSQRPDYD